MWCETHGLRYGSSAIGIVVILRGDFYAFSASQNPLGGNPRVNMSLSYIYNELCFTGVVCVHLYSTGEGIRLRYVPSVLIAHISKNSHMQR